MLARVLARVEVLEQTAEVLWAQAALPEGVIECMASVRSLGKDTLELYEIHVEGPGARAVGGPRVRQLAQAFVNEIGPRYGVRYVILRGGRRTSGAGKGRRPRPLRFEVER